MALAPLRLPVAAARFRAAWLLTIACCGAALGGCGLVVTERDPGVEGGGGGRPSSGSGDGKWDPSCLRDMTGYQAQSLSCFAKESAGDACPSIYQATLFLAPTRACAYIVSVDCGPVDGGEHCCYLITEEEAACQ